MWFSIAVCGRQMWRQKSVPTPISTVFAPHSGISAFAMLNLLPQGYVLYPLVLRFCLSLSMFWFLISIDVTACDASYV